jgi:prepilin-type N-terminal cleavage/methylation domain-containing protein
MATMRRLYNRDGFTLIELAVVLVIVGIVISIISGVLPTLIESSKIKQAQALLEKAEYALQGYSIANHRLPFADSGTDGLEDAGIFVGNLPFRTLGLSSGDDVWGSRIKYAVYGVAGGANNLTQNFANANAFCVAINNASTSAFNINIAHTTTASPCNAAAAANSSNQAFILASSGLKDLDGVNGRFDLCNGQPGTGFNIPGQTQSTTYDDLVRAFSLNELNQKNCLGSGGGGGGGTAEICNDVGNADEDGDGLANCLDPDCVAHPSCTGATALDITTTAVPSGALTSSYMTTFAATGGTAPYTWSLVSNGGFSDFAINPSTGTLSGTVNQCPGNYTVTVQARDNTPVASGGPQTDSQSVTLQVISTLALTRTSGAGTAITWSSPTQQESFSANNQRLGSINWTLNSGGATGFGVSSTGAGTCAIRKTGSSSPGTYTFTLTGTDASCPTNSANLVLTVTVAPAGAGAPGGIGGVEDTLVWDNSAGYNPDIVNVGGDIYAIAYTGQANRGFLRTVQIGTDGQIANNTIGLLQFDGTRAIDPDIIRVTNDIFAIAYTDNNGFGRLVTVQIAANGQITAGTISALTFDNGYCYEPDIIQIGGNIFAIAYTGPGNDGFVKTFQIADNGSIGTVIDTLEFDPINALETDIVQVTGGVYAIAYRGASNDGFVATISIDNAGQIGDAILDSFEFDTADCTNPDMIALGSNIFAVAYTGAANDGFISTIQIASNGLITKTVVSSLEFDTTNGMEPVVMSAGNGIYGIAYRGTGDDGFFSTVQIDAAGQIAGAVTDTLEYDVANGMEPAMIQVGSGVFAVTYRGQSNRGSLATIQLQ